MKRFLLLSLGAVSVLDSTGVLAQAVPDCVPGCANQLRGQFAQFSCTSADDAACLCAAPNFFYGVRDCAPACANDAQVFDYLTGSFCQGQSIPITPTASQPTVSPTLPPSDSAPVPLVTGSPTSSATDAPTSPPPTSSPPTTAAPSETGTVTSPAVVSAPTSSGATSPAEPTGTSSTASATSSATSATSAAAAPTGSADPPPTSASSSAGSDAKEASKPSHGSGLSSGAAIGVGVGVGLAVLVVGAIAGFFMWRNRKRSSTDSIDISKTSPGSDRSSPDGSRGPFEKYANDLEMVSQRYEDMVPRTQPRTLV